MESTLLRSTDLVPATMLLFIFFISMQGREEGYCRKQICKHFQRFLFRNKILDFETLLSLYKRTKYGICNKVKEPLKRTEY